LKSLIKYSATLFTLLLLGYTQVFAHIHRDDFSSVTKAKRSHHFEVPVAKTSEIGGDYFEEENKRNVLKTYSRENTSSDFFYAHISAAYFFQRLKTFSSFGERTSRLATFRASLFRVLRL
jgi:hypothetical protein